jgi:hypothetical protein
MRTFYCFAAIVVAGCSSSGTIETSVSSSALTGAPGRFEGPAHLSVTIREVAVHIGSEIDEQDQTEDAAWTTVFSGPTRIDLYDTGLVSKMLSSAPAPAGPVTQVRLVLDDDPTLTVDGVALPVSCPSCTETGIKIVTHGALEVPEGGTLFLTLDFDQDASLHTDGHGGYILQPTVRL